jgi:hypothetical protein
VNSSLISSSILSRSRKKSISFKNKVNVSWSFLRSRRAKLLTFISLIFIMRIERFCRAARRSMKMQYEEELRYRILKRFFCLIASLMRLIFSSASESKSCDATLIVLRKNESKSRDATSIVSRDELKSRDATLIWNEFFVSILENELIMLLWNKKLKSRDAILTLMRTCSCSSRFFAFYTFWLFAENRNFSSR